MELSEFGSLHKYILHGTVFQDNGNITVLKFIYKIKMPNKMMICILIKF